MNKKALNGWIVVGLVALVSNGHAQSLASSKWTGESGGNWNAAENWSRSEVPSAERSQYAVIDNGGTAVIDSAVPAVPRTEVGNGALIVRNGGSLNTSGTWDGLRVGVLGGTGALTIEAGGSVDVGSNRNLYVTSKTGDTGSVTVSGSLSVGQLFFGQGAATSLASFTMNAGSIVAVASHLQMANDGGTGNSFTYNGGSLSTGGLLRIKGTRMTVNYDAAGSISVGSTLSIADNGTLVFNASPNGVMMISPLAEIAFAAGSQIIVDMSGAGSLRPGTYTLFEYHSVAMNSVVATVLNAPEHISASIVDTGEAYELVVIPEPAAGAVIVALGGLAFLVRRRLMRSR